MAAPRRPATPLLIDGLGVRYPGGASTPRGRRPPVAAGERVGIAGRTGAGKSTLALAAAGFIPRVVRAKLDGRVTIDGQDAATAAARRAPRPGRDRLRDTRQPAVGIEADRARGARLRPREPGHAARGDGRADRRDPRPPVDRSPRRPRAVRAVRRRAAARGDREHRGDGHARPGARRADCPARPGRDHCRSPTSSTNWRGPAPRSCAPPTIRASSAGWTAGWCSKRDGPSRSTPRARRCPSGAARWAVTADPRPARARRGDAPGQAFDEAASRRGSARRRQADGRPAPDAAPAPTCRSRRRPGPTAVTGRPSESPSRISSIATRAASRPSVACR